MTPEERELLKRSIALSEENNDILRGIQRSMRIARFMTLVYWLFIIGSAVGAYYVIQPYLKQLTDIYTLGQGNINNNVSAISDLFKSLKDLQQ